MVAFLVGWALLGLVASALPFTAGFSSDGREPVEIPPNDPRHSLHERSAALAAHLVLARTPPEEPLDPNRATAADLDRLPGVGPRIALAWVVVRDSVGPFLALPDLARVKGLGAARLREMLPYLRFPPNERSRTVASTPERVAVNRATLRELDGLPGVGPVLARRIVEYRSAHGRFRSPADLDRVPGVGAVLLRALSERLSFE
jgi:competence ComEA-like helix-hairpin-helix protein